jgi:hypothetical protein
MTSKKIGGGFQDQTFRMWPGPGAGGGGGGVAEKARRRVQDVRVMSGESFASLVSGTRGHPIWTVCAALYSQVRPISQPIVVFPVTFCLPPKTATTCVVANGI